MPSWKGKWSHPCQKLENGLYLALNPEMLQHVIRQLAEQIKSSSGLSQNPVILTSQVMRIHFYHLVEPFYPNIRVLSFNEIANNVQDPVNWKYKYNGKRIISVQLNDINSR